MNTLPMLAAAMCLTAFANAAAASTACAAPQNVNQMAGEIAQGLNASRAAQGLPALQFNPQLGQAAMVHACDMSANNFFDHGGTDGSTVARRVTSSGYQHCLVAENLAWGYPRSEQIISGWLNSPGHRTNMLHPRVAEFGIGITQGPRGPNWVLVLAKGC